jgi:hypothetical protein
MAIRQVAPSQIGKAMDYALGRNDMKLIGPDYQKRTFIIDGGANDLATAEELLKQKPWGEDTVGIQERGAGATANAPAKDSLTRWRERWEAFVSNAAPWNGKNME